ncbi:MAG: NAD(P)-dependent oxidoreductase [Patescibacteria group bacterium]|nr:NAD(P)-dependent oxidoreductase [Patescibacteria group bacterium]
MPHDKLVVTNRVVDVPFDAITSRANLIIPSDPARSMSRSEVLEHAAELVALINWSDVRVDAELLAAAPRLRIVANACAGFDNFDLPRMTEAGVWATNAPEAFADCTADLAFGLLLAAARRIVRADAFIRAGVWPDAADRMTLTGGMLLRGKTLGIVGYGRIGRAMAERAVGFGMQVIHCHRAACSDSAACRTLDELLAEADIVSLHVPLNAGTNRLVTAERLARMKPGALLVNVSRGRVVDEAALIESLRAGRLAGAALDVFEGEPNVSEELRALENVVLTPHIGGAVAESQQIALQWCIDNVVAVLDGEAPRHPLNQPFNVATPLG